jgi:predicted  nucleic acid-binding Zn-ribbon protein
MITRLQFESKIKYLKDRRNVWRDQALEAANKLQAMSRDKEAVENAYHSRVVCMEADYAKLRQERDVLEKNGNVQRGKILNLERELKDVHSDEDLEKRVAARAKILAVTYERQIEELRRVYELDTIRRREGAGRSHSEIARLERLVEVQKRELMKLRGSEPYFVNTNAEIERLKAQISNNNDFRSEACVKVQELRNEKEALCKKLIETVESKAALHNHIRELNLKIATLQSRCDAGFKEYVTATECKLSTDLFFANETIKQLKRDSVALKYQLNPPHENWICCPPQVSNPNNMFAQFMKKNLDK